MGLTTSRKRTMILLIIAGLYAVAQVGIYSAAISAIPCSQVNSLMITILVSEILFVIWTAVAIVSMQRFGLMFVMLGLGTITALMKLACIIWLAVVGNKHLGECYIVKTTRSLIIADLSVELGLVIVLMVLTELVRRRAEAVI